MKTNKNKSADYLNRLCSAIYLLDLQNDEKWREIDFIPNIDLQEKYYISNYGKVISLCRDIPIALKPFERKGYYTVELCGTNYSIHRLVALAFIHNPQGKRIVHHIDGNKHNNNYKNLAWATDSENVNASIQQRKAKK